MLGAQDTNHKTVLKTLDEKKDDLLKFINKKIDIPKLTEEQEAKLLNSIYNILYDVIKILLTK